MGVVVKQSILGTIVNYIGVAIGAFTTFFILTRYLTAEEVGLTRVLVEAATLLSGLAQLGTSASILRFFPYFKNEEKNHNGFFFWTIIIPLVGLLIFSLIYLLLKVPITDYFQEKSQLFNNFYFYVLPLAFFLVYITVSESNSNVLLKIVFPKFVREVLVRILSLVLYFLYAFKVLSLNGFVIGFCVVYGIAMIVDLTYLFATGKVSLKPDFSYITPSLRKQYLLYTAFLVVAALATTITPFLNTFFISAEMGLTFTGIYTIAVFIAAVVEVPYRSLGSISQPHISQAVKDNNIEEVNRLCKSVSLHQLLVGSFILLIIWMNIDFIFKVIPNGDIYSSGKWVVLILGLTKLIYSTFNVGITVLSFSKYYYNSLIFTIILAASAIILNISLIPVLGMNGAAVATLLSNIIYYLLMLTYNKYKIKTSPLSIKQLKITTIILILFIINILWNKYLTPNIIVENSSIIALILESAVKTIIICTIGLLIVYKSRISNDVNQIIYKFMRKVVIRK